MFARFHRRSAGMVGCLGVTLLASVSCPGRASAQSGTWVSPTSGNWSNAANWLGGVIPGPSPSTAITFSDGTYTAANDLTATPFVLNALTFGNSGSMTISDQGQGLFFSGSSPSITMGSGNAIVNPVISLGASVTIAGGSGNLTLNGAINGSAVGAFNLIQNSGGTTTLAGGGTLNSLSVQAGLSSAIGGTLTLTSPTGPGNASAGLQIGAASGQTANFMASNGANVNVIENVYVGDAAGSTGILTVSGAGTVLNATGGTSSRLGVGNGGAGTLNVTNGGAVNAGILFTSGQVGSSGNIVVDGAGSALHVVGQATIASQGPSTVTVSNGGLVQIAGPLTNLSGGVLTGGSYVVQDNSTLALNAPANSIKTISANTVVELDGAAPNFPALSSSGNTALSTVNGTLVIGAGGTFSGNQLLTVGPTGTLSVQSTVVQGVITVPAVVNQAVSIFGTLKGNGTVGSSANPLIIQPGGSLQPGNSPGTITVGGKMTLMGTYVWDLGGNSTTMAGSSDQVIVDGTTTIDPPLIVPNFITGANGTAGVNFDDPFWNSPQTWTIIKAVGGFVETNLNSPPPLRLPTDTFGSHAQGTFFLAYQPNALTLNWSPAVVSTQFTGGGNSNWSDGGNWEPAVPVSGANTQLVFGPTPNPTMINDFPFTFILNSMTFTSGSPAYTLNGGALDFRTNGAGALPQIVTNSANSVTIGVPMTLNNNLTVSGSGNLTLNGVIDGPSSLTIAGSGTVTLGNAANSFSGGTNIQSGTLQVASDAALGTGNVSGNFLGTVSFTGSTSTTKSFAMNGGTIAVAAGTTLTFGGGPISGAFLDGSGTFATNPTTGATFVGVTSEQSAAITSNSAADQFIHFTNSSPLTVAPGINTTGGSTNVNLNGFLNQGVGSVTVGAGSRINVANFQSYGTLTLNPATGTQVTLVTNLGGSILGFNGGSRTFIGTPGTAGTNVAGVNLHGQNIVIAGGLFVNNGFLADSTSTPGSVIVDYGSLFKGSGTNFVNVITQNGGKVQAGNSPGAAVYGNLTLGPGGIGSYLWQINDAGPSASHPSAPGVAGPTANANNQVSGWSVLQSNISVNPLTGVATTGNLTWTATSQPGNQFVLSLETLQGPFTTVGTDNPGPMADFSTTTYYQWPIITFEGTYTGPTDSATLTADTLIDASQFQNSSPPGGFYIRFDAANHSIDLGYPTPEPGTLSLGSLAGLGLAWAARRRRASLWSAFAVIVPNPAE